VARGVDHLAPVADRLVTGAQDGVGVLLGRGGRAEYEAGGVRAAEEIEQAYALAVRVKDGRVGGAVSGDERARGGT